MIATATPQRVKFQGRAFWLLDGSPFTDGILDDDCDDNGKPSRPFGYAVIEEGKVMRFKQVIGEADDITAWEDEDDADVDPKA